MRSIISPTTNYINKIMLDTCMYNKITNNKFKDTYDGSRYKDINHFIFNFIDDSTNIISHNDSALITEYMNYYYILLEIYYNENKLLINGDKTVLLVSCQNKMRNLANTIKLQAGDFIIEQTDNIRILGYNVQNLLVSMEE